MRTLRYGCWAYIPLPVTFPPDDSVCLCPVRPPPAVPSLPLLITRILPHCQRSYHYLPDDAAYRYVVERLHLPSVPLPYPLPRCLQHRSYLVGLVGFTCHVAAPACCYHHHRLLCHRPTYHPLLQRAAVALPRICVRRLVSVGRCC